MLLRGLSAGLAQVWSFPAASQQRARRNALVASTGLAARRKERADAEAAWLAYQARYAARQGRARRATPPAAAGG